MTATLTPTSTPAAGVTMAKHASETTAQAGTTFTYSIGITVTGNSVNNLVVTDHIAVRIDLCGIWNHSGGNRVQPRIHRI